MRRTEIYQDGTYLKMHPTWDAADSSWKVSWIRTLLNRNNTRFNSIADVGCGAGEVLKQLHAHYPHTASWQGFDISADSIRLATADGRKDISFHDADFLQTSQDHLDLILVIDVLEHLADFYGFLEQLQTRAQQFVFHVPLDLSCRTVMKPHVLSQQRESVGHIHYFTKDMVLWMLSDTGYEVTDWMFTKPLHDLVAGGGVKRNIKRTLRNLSYSIWPQRSVALWGGYSMMILAKSAT